MYDIIDDMTNRIRILQVENAELRARFEKADRRAEVAERALNKACADIEAVRKQAVIEFAVRLKKKADSYNYDVNYINRSVMYTDIDDLATEVCGE